MVAQNNGKIYKVQNIAGDKIYIGSTNKKYLSQRMDTHRSDYKRWKAGKTGKVYSFDIFDEYGIENCVIVLIENYPCGSKDELRAREAHFIQTMVCVNKNIPGRTVEQYHEDNKEQIAEYSKEYYKNYNIVNKEKNALQKREYYENNKEQMTENMKKYQETHKEQITENIKKYQETHKEQIAKYNKIRYEAKKLAKLNQVEIEVAVIDDQNNIITALQG